MFITIRIISSRAIASIENYYHQLPIVLSSNCYAQGLTRLILRPKQDLSNPAYIGLISGVINRVNNAISNTYRLT